MRKRSHLFHKHIQFRILWVTNHQPFLGKMFIFQYWMHHTEILFKFGCDCFYVMKNSAGSSYHVSTVQSPEKKYESLIFLRHMSHGNFRPVLMSNLPLPVPVDSLILCFSLLQETCIRSIFFFYIAKIFTHYFTDFPPHIFFFNYIAIVSIIFLPQNLIHFKLLINFTHFSWSHDMMASSKRANTRDNCAGSYLRVAANMRKAN